MDYVLDIYSNGKKLKTQLLQKDKFIELYQLKCTDCIKSYRVLSSIIFIKLNKG